MSDNAWSQFHRLWTWAVGLPGYDKKAWQDLLHAIFDPKTSKIRAPAPASPPAEPGTCLACEDLRAWTRSERPAPDLTLQHTCGTGRRDTEER